MANLSRSNLNLGHEEIAEIYNFREKSIRLFYSDINPEYTELFAGYLQSDLNEELNYHLLEAEKDACLNLLGSIEAKFRVDYAIRCEKKDKSDISKRFRTLYAEYQYRLPLEDVIFEEWKNSGLIKNSIISELKGAFKYRHWLAHGRYWVLKAGKPKYDFYELYNLALEIDMLNLKD